MWKIQPPHQLSCPLTLDIPIEIRIHLFVSRLNILALSRSATRCTFLRVVYSLFRDWSRLQRERNLEYTHTHTHTQQCIIIADSILAVGGPPICSTRSELIEKIARWRGGIERDFADKRSSASFIYFLFSPGFISLLFSLSPLRIRPLSLCTRPPNTPCIRFFSLSLPLAFRSLSLALKQKVNHEWVDEEEEEAEEAVVYRRGFKDNEYMA